MLTFEQIIDRLNTFWTTQNCIIHQGYDVEVGAGTLNPATFLRCIGKDPYKAAFVEFCRRPKEADYGNPHRFQFSHQYQVLLKPVPTDVRVLYFNSLLALDFILKKHDIRFVQNDWETSSLGISGLGWQIWCDGSQITQLTYLQTVGDIALKPISAEITYDLEKLALFIQKKTAVFDIQYNHIFTLRDLFLQMEVEWSHYNFTEASVPMWLRHFNDYEQESKNLIKNNLPIPAYDFVIKASHAFNVLDARGAISFAERNSYIRRIRDLTHLVAKAILSRQVALMMPSITTKFIVQKNSSFNPKNTRDFLLEIGSEQLPASFISIGCLYLENAIRNLLEAAELEFEELQVFGTSQRLSILVKNLVEGTETIEEQIKGPSLDTAFDKRGHLTKQGKGFLLTHNISFCTLSEIMQEETPSLYLVSMKGIKYLVAKICIKGKSTYELLQKNLPSLIKNIDFPKKMYWEDLSVTYARPIQWIVALFGNQIIPFNLGRIPSGNFSFGHFQLSPMPIEIKQPKNYLSSLKNHYVLADIEERKEHIEGQIKILEQQVQGHAIEQNKVLTEVLYTMEWPTLLLCFFDTAFLRIPKEVLILQITKHKKYFPLMDLHDQLMPVFILPIDTHPNQTIQLGNEKALSSLLSDVATLYEKDLYNPLELNYYKLQEISYQKNYKTLWNKVERLNVIAAMIHQVLGIGEYTHIQRAALLSKSDLCSMLVKEFPDLRGTIGKYYALAQNEKSQVAIALEEQWMPRSKHAPIPETPTGIVLSLADKIDDLIRCNNPCILRKQANAILRILIENKMHCDLQLLLAKACQFFPITNKKKTAKEILRFITARKKQAFKELKFRKDEVDAISLINPYDLFDQLRRLEALQTLRNSKRNFSCLIKMHKRIKRQVRGSSTATFNNTLVKNPAEKKLLQELTVLNKHWPKLLQEKQYLQAFELLIKLQPSLEKFFRTVKILTDDPILRVNRCALLKKALKFFDTLIDFSKLSSS